MEEIDCSTVIIENFNTTLSTLDKLLRQIQQGNIGLEVCFRQNGPNIFIEHFI